MLSYAFSTASSYFHLPVDEEEDEDILTWERKYLTWTAEPSPPSLSSTSLLSPSPTTLASTINPEPDTETESDTNETVHAVLSDNDLYSILGVQRTISLDKITLRKAYLSRSRACHPDKFPINNASATLAFQKVAVAYNILSNPSSKRNYDGRSPASNYDVFAVRPSGFAEETFRGVVISVFNDFLDGDMEVIKTFLRAVSDINPSLSLGEDGMESVLVALQSIRERALSCRTCLFALHGQFHRLLETKHELQQLSYFDLFGRSRLTIQLTRITLSIPIVVETALMEQKALYGTGPPDENQNAALLPRHVLGLIRTIDIGLQRLERILK
ncbi:DnaJ-domain-containing protein [Marasmius fiardii PR-910]|nr:DnaJ-domain-containing protein [Marasmius fiardii PR-910]